MASTDPWRVQWDQAAADIEAARALEYTGYIDGTPGPLTVTVVPGNGSANGLPLFVCVAPLPPLPQGPLPHTIQVTAKNAAGESAKSASVSFFTVVVPPAPSGVRVLAPSP